MEEKHILVFLVCTVAVLGIMSILSCVRVYAFNEMFAAYEQAYNASVSHGSPSTHFENITYYSIGSTRNRTDLRVENIGTAQFVVSSALWSPSGSIQSTTQLLALTPEEYEMHPSSGIILPNCTLLITVKWGVPNGNISENEWSPEESYYWKIDSTHSSNFCTMVKPGDDLSAQAAEEAAWYRKTSAESLANSQETHAWLLNEKSLFINQLCILVSSTFIATSMSFYMARRFKLGLRSVFQKQVIALVTWIIFSAPILFTASVILTAIKNQFWWILTSAEDLWHYWYWTAMGSLEPSFLEVWLLTCLLGALSIYLVFNFRQRTAIPYYKSLWLSLIGAAFVFSAFTVTLPLTDSVEITTMQLSAGVSMAILAACATVAAPFANRIKVHANRLRKSWKLRVGLTKSDFAVIFGGIALLMSVAYPLFNHLVTAETDSGEPVLSIGKVYVTACNTYIELSNSGNATCHNVRLEVLYGGHGIPPIVNVRDTEFIPKLDAGDTIEVYIPIGKSILLEQTSDLSRYTLAITLESDETSVQSFHRDPFMILPQS